MNTNEINEQRIIILAGLEVLYAVSSIYQSFANLENSILFSKFANMEGYASFDK